MEEIIDKFREMFLTETDNSNALKNDRNYYCMKGFFWLERRIAYLNHWTKNNDIRTSKCINTLSDTFGNNSNEIVMFPDKIGKKKLSDDEMLLKFKDKIVGYISGLKKDDLEQFFNGFFNNFIRVTNNPEYYEYVDKTGVINFAWNNIEEIKELLNTRGKIEAFANFLIENYGLKLTLKKFDSTYLENRIEELNKKRNKQNQKCIRDKLVSFFKHKEKSIHTISKKNKKQIQHEFDRTDEIIEGYQQVIQDEDVDIIRILLNDETITIENITMEQYKQALSNYNEIKDEIDKFYQINVRVALRKCKNKFPEQSKYPENQIKEIRLLETRAGLRGKSH